MRQISMVFILVIGAVLLAIATFIAILTIANRPDSPEVALAPQLEAPVVPDQVHVDGIDVFLETDPQQAVQLVNEAVPPEIVAAPETLPEEPAPPPAVEEVQPPPAPAVEQPTPIPPAAPAVQQIIFVDYVVQPGDTLYGIANRHNTSIELMAVHHISAANLIPGHTIRVPVPNPAYCPGRRPYVVRDKDTAFRIARQFSTTAETLRQINNLDPNYTLRIAAVICVP